MILPVAQLQKHTLLSSIVTLSPLITSWQWKSLNGTISTLPNFIFMKNSPTSGLFNYQIKPRNNYPGWEIQGYSQFKVETEIAYPENWTSPFYITSPLYPESPYNNTVASTWQNLQFAVSPNLDITLGLHTIIIKFKITAFRNGEKKILSTYDFPVNIHVFEEGVFNSPLSMTFYKSENTSPAQALIVGGGDWTLTVPKGIKITSTQTSVVPLEYGGYSASGSGNVTFQTTLDSNINEVVGFQETTNLSAVISYENTNNTLPITVIQTGDVFPSALVFNISSGFLDYDFQQVTINKPGVLTFTNSTFLNVELYEEDGVRRLNVFPIDADNFTEGVYNGEIVITIDTSSYVVPVTINVNNSFDIGLSNTEIPFTRSMEDLHFTSSNQNAVMEIIFSTNQDVNQFRYLIPFLNGECKKNIGVVMDRLIKFTNDSLTASYNLPYFDLQLREKNGSTVLNSFFKNNIYIMKGFKPYLDNNFAILQHNSTSRFTPNSFALVNILSGTGNFQYKLLKNEEEVFSSSNLFGYISTIQLNFEEYQASAGDYFTFELLTPGGKIAKSFIIYPETETSFEIVYEDSFGLKSVLNFTGNSVEEVREINAVFESYQKKSHFHFRKVNVSDEQSLTLNTGYILNSQILEVDELLDATRVWLYVNGERKLSLIPKTKKIVKKDNQRFLIQYEVEFYINPEEYAPNYNS